MPENRWEFVCRLEKNGHRLFKDRHAGGKPSLCDNSGKRPHLTEDGPLYLDFGRKLRIHEWGQSVGLTVPVSRSVEGGGPYSTGVGLDGALKLMELYPSWEIAEPEGDFSKLAKFVVEAAKRIKTTVAVEEPITS